MKHTIWHLLGCLLPLFVIFLLPLLGVGHGIALFLFIILMFACHLLIMRGHGQKSGRIQHEIQHGDHSHEPH